MNPLTLILAHAIGGAVITALAAFTAAMFELVASWRWIDVDWPRTFAIWLVVSLLGGFWGGAIALGLITYS